jgi:predicted DCC family thiol-disulfide oxidoreductase YuxK
MAGPIVLYDGVCGLCDRTVQFVLARDPGGLFRFAALQSAFAQERVARHGFSAADLDTVYVVLDPDTANERLLRRSRAILAILALLGGAWGLLARVIGVLPTFLLDLGYRLVARTRYRIFGRLDACRVPAADERQRFLS